jgi:hypothetical protein
MKRLLIAIAACSATVALADLYKYVDKDGRTVYSDQAPPGGNAKVIATPPPPPAAPATTKTAVERDKDAQKSRDEAKKKGGKAEENEKAAQAAEARCADARRAFQTYSVGGRLFKTDAKGERVFLNDDEIMAERERSRRDMDEACKK